MRARPPSPRAVHFLAALLLAGAFAGCTSSLPPPTPEAPPVFAHKWGAYGPAPGQFNTPTGVAVDSGGNVYVTDSANNRVQKFSSAGVLLTSWGSQGSAPGQMKFPTAIAIDAAGNVLVVDSYNHRVQKFSPTGAFISSFGSAGVGNGQFLMARGIALDAQGNIFVADANAHRVQKFNSTGGFVAKWGTPGAGAGQFQFPRGIAVDPSGTVFVADYANHRVQRFDNAGNFLLQWGSLGAADGQFDHPYGIAADAAGNVFVSDVLNHRVQKFNGLGGFLCAWGTHGTSNGAFDEPYGIALDAAPNNVFVVDGANNRIERFRYLPNSIDVDVLLDGAPWAGAVGFTLNGPQTFSGASAPYDVAPAAPGTYSVAYVAGGPPGAHFVGASPPQPLAAGGSATLTLHFTLPTNVDVRATLDGTPWAGPVNYTLWGLLSASPTTTATYAGTVAPATFANVSEGTDILTDPATNTTGPGAHYALSFISGGPPGATLVSIGPQPSQPLFAHQTKTFVLNFRTDGLAPNSIIVNATLDGAPWAGAVNSSIGLFTWPAPAGSFFQLTSAPVTLSGLPPGAQQLTDPHTGQTGLGGVYAAIYVSGGPPGATFVGFAPDFWQILLANGTKTFTMQFVSPPATTGDAHVEATLDGAPWTGPVSYSLAGPQSVSGASVPLSHAGLAPGTYTLTVTGGGPPGATLTTVAPTATQALAAGDDATWTLHFRSRPVANGTLHVAATLDGAPWSGPLNFTIAGTSAFAGTSAPFAASAAPGSYSLSYVSGGPAAANLVAITPPTLSLVAGGGATFTLAFESAPNGTIVVEATASGAMGSVPWTGPLQFNISGPQALAGTSVSHTFAGVPIGAYTLTYVSGGPPGTTLQTVSPSPTQTLAAGGTIVFRMNFR